LAEAARFLLANWDMDDGSSSSIANTDSAIGHQASMSNGIDYPFPHQVPIMTNDTHNHNPFATAAPDWAINQPQFNIAVYNPPINTQAHAPQIPGGTPLDCPHGCTGTFRRTTEYRRHMKKHNGPFHPCTVPNCGKTFYRGDKLRDHLRQGHRQE
jgi:hypothetical protein